MSLVLMLVALLILATVYFYLLKDFNLQADTRRRLAQQRVFAAHIRRELRYLQEDNRMIMAELAEWETRMSGEKVNWQQEGF